MNNKQYPLVLMAVLGLSCVGQVTAAPQRGISPRVEQIDVNAPLAPGAAQRASIQRDPMFRADGPYVSAHVGYGYINADTDRYSNDSNYDVSRTDFAWALTGGYQLNDAAAIELSYMNMPNTRIKNKTTELTDKHDITAMSLMFKGSMPVSPEQDVFGKIGWVALRDTDKIYDTSGNVVDSNKAYGSANTVMFGFGTDFHTQPNLDLTAQLLFSPEKDNRMPGTMTLLAGFTFRFV